MLRALFGIAMGGEWGLGSSLAMESIPPQARGTVSGILQCGYPTGFLLAAIVYGLLYGRTFGDYTFGWRGMFLLSVLPAFVVLFIRSSVPESPAFEASQAHAKPNLWETLKRAQRAGPLHGRADDVLQSVQPRHAGPLSDLPAEAAQVRSRHGELDHHRRQSRRDRRTASSFGHFSEKIGRVNAITIASLIALPALPLWAFGSTPVLLALGAFVMQVAVQGAWGVIPAHLNELAPGAARATIPAFVYQAGNFLASYNGPFQAQTRRRRTAATMAFALAVVAAMVAVAIIIVIRFSPERRGQILTAH